MRPRLPEEIRRKVINDWLSGYGRDEISPRTGASTGTVSNIGNTLEQDLGKAEADALRELEKSIRLSPAQYMVGIRISNMLKRVGLDPTRLLSCRQKRDRQSWEVSIQFLRGNLLGTTCAFNSRTLLECLSFQTVPVYQIALLKNVSGASIVFWPQETQE